MGFAQRKTGTPKPIKALSEDQWREEVQLITRTHRRLSDAVAGFDPTKLDKPLNTRSPRPAIESIHGMAEHTLYHTGQLKLVKLLARRALGGS